MSINNKHLMTLGLIGVAGHVIGIAADLYSGFVPVLEADLGPITSTSLANIAPLFREKSLIEARIGHYLAVLFIPLGVAGIWQIFLAMEPFKNSRAFAFLGFGTLGVIYGSFYHGTLAFITAAIQIKPAGVLAGLDGADSYLAYVNSLSEPLSLILLGSDLVVSVIYIYVVISSSTMFPKWMAAFNPLSIQLILSALILLAPPPLNLILWLTVFNGSLAIWYSGTTITLARRGGISRREAMVSGN